jgi:hypothetical protein
MILKRLFGLIKNDKQIGEDRNNGGFLKLD